MGIGKQRKVKLRMRDELFLLKGFSTVAAHLGSPGELLKVSVLDHTASQLNQHPWGWDRVSVFSKAPQVIPMGHPGQESLSKYGGAGSSQKL